MVHLVDGSDGSIISAGGVSLGQMAQFGLLGLIFICVVLRKFVVPEWTLTQAEASHASELALKDDQISALKADKAEMKEHLEQLQQLTRSEVIPALVRANQLTSQLILRGSSDVQP